MKIRSSFVSNSSSSSFIVKFPKVPKTAQELQKMLFGDQEVIQPFDDAFPASVLAETVFNDMQEPKSVNTNEAITDLLTNSWEAGEEADRIFGKDYFQIHEKGRLHKEVEEDAQKHKAIEEQVARRMREDFMMKDGEV